MEQENERTPKRASWASKSFKESVRTMEQENGSTPKHLSGPSRTRRARRSAVSPGNEDLFDTEVPPPLSQPPVSSNSNSPQFQASAAAGNPSDLEAINQKKEKLNKLMAPITSMCGVIAMGGVGFNLSLSQRRRNLFLQSSTVILLICFFFFLLLWVVMWFAKDLWILSFLEWVFYGFLVFLIVALTLGGLALV